MFFWNLRLICFGLLTLCLYELVLWQGSGAADSTTSLEAPSGTSALQRVEGLALAMMCSTRPTTRKLAIIILKEVRNLSQLLTVDHSLGDDTVMNVIEKVSSNVVHKCLSLLPEKTRVRISVQCCQTFPIGLPASLPLFSLCFQLPFWHCYWHD